MISLLEHNPVTSPTTRNSESDLLWGFNEIAGYFAEQYQELRDVAGEIQAAQAAVLRKHLPALRRAATRAQTTRAMIEAAIPRYPELFEKRRLPVFHGIKLGLIKGKGRLEIPCEAVTIKKIQSLFSPAEAAQYLRVSIEPNKQTLANLPASDLRKLGVNLTGTGDIVVVKPMNGDVDHYVSALLQPPENRAQAATKK